MNERDVRAWLTERAPTAAPEELRTRVAAISTAPPLADRGPGRLRPRGAIQRSRSWRAPLLVAAALGTSIAGAVLLAGIQRDGPPPSQDPISGPRNGVIAIVSGSVRMIDPVTGRQLLDEAHPAHLTYSGAWSPDGRMLVFAVRDAIWTLDVATGEERLLASVEGCLGQQWWDCELAWSPDGHTIAISADTRLLYVDTSSGQVRLRLERPGADVRSPAWSPDGSTIAFIQGASLLTAPAADGPATEILREPDEAWLPRDVAWSPDGSTLAWMTFSPRDDDFARGIIAKRAVIASAHADGSDRRDRIEAGGCFCVSGSWGPPGFTWSPDGTRMAFVSQHDQFGTSAEPAGGLYIVNADGSDARLLLPGVQGRPIWQPLP